MKAFNDKGRERKDGEGVVSAITGQGIRRESRPGSRPTLSQAKQDTLNYILQMRERGWGPWIDMTPEQIEAWVNSSLDHAQSLKKAGDGGELRT